LVQSGTKLTNANHLDALDIQTLESLAHLQHIVSKATLDFCQGIQFTHPFTSEKSGRPENLSGSEKRRMYRAFYHLELFRALFIGVRNSRLSHPLANSFDTQDQSWLFLSIFEPWVVEEIACVCDYISNRYSELLRESYSELSKIRPEKVPNDGE
jgi:hypothetical protein